MKKYLLFILIQVFATQVTIASDLTPTQIKLRNEIQAFLKEEGFMPEIDSDGDIRFKKEGSVYYISINENDESPMYINFYRAFNYPEKYSPDIVKMATAELNKYKGVKVVCYESSFSIQSNMYLVSAEAFKYAFYSLMSQMANVQEDFMEECSKIGNLGGQSPSALSSRIPFIITSMEVANTDKNGGIIQDYGSRIYDYKTQYLKPRITISPLKTSGTYTVYIKLYKDGSLRTGTSSPSGYSYSDTITLSGSSSTTITLSGWGSATSGHWSAGQYRFEVWYGDYCLGSKSFTVI